MKKVDILGVSVTDIQKSELLEYLMLDAKSVELVNNVNVRAFNLAKKNESFRRILNSSEVVFCDGFGVKVGAWILGLKIGERMTPPDWIDLFFEMAIERERTLYFLGDEDEVMSKFVAKVQNRFSRLKVLGYHNGFLTKEEGENVIASLRDLKPDFIITAMGMPIQEEWASANQNRLHPCKIIATGALPRWYTGINKRGPRILTNFGMEWFTRLFYQPAKVWDRYLIGIPSFLLDIIILKISKMLHRG